MGPHNDYDVGFEVCPFDRREGGLKDVTEQRLVR
jgi:hypothetical protein